MSNNEGSEHVWRESLLAQMRDESVLGANELSLFEWYLRENAKITDKMLAEEREVIQQQIEAGIDVVNDGGMLAFEYYIKRVRYADIIYMASLLESYLSQACEKLIAASGAHNIIFQPDELAGDKWTKRKRFLERYGRFEFPTEAWSSLQTLIRVRNILVHENGSSDTISQDDRNRIERSPGISASHGELVIEVDYIDHCFSAFRSLVGFVDEQFDRAIDRSLRRATGVGDSGEVSGS